MLHNMFDYIIIGFDSMWQTFKLLSWPSITSLACANMVFFKEYTCCLIVSLMFFSESFPLNPAASAIKHKKNMSITFSALWWQCKCVLLYCQSVCVIILYLTLVAVLHFALDCCCQTVVDCFLFLPDGFVENSLNFLFLREKNNTRQHILFPQVFKFSIFKYVCRVKSCVCGFPACVLSNAI